MKAEVVVVALFFFVFLVLGTDRSRSLRTLSAVAHHAVSPRSTGCEMSQPCIRNVLVTPTPGLFQKYCRTNGGGTAVQMGGVLQYKWEAYCRVSLSSKLRSQQSTVIQMGGVLPYKLEAYPLTQNYYLRKIILK